MVRSVNLQVHRLAPTYLKLTHQHVFHTSNLPEGAAGLETSLFLEDIHGGNSQKTQKLYQI